LLGAINSRRVRLPDHSRLVQQLVGLERRTARSGKDSIDHAPGGHDDVCNAVAGLCAAALGQYGSYDYEYRGFSDDPRINGDQPQPPAPQTPDPRFFGTADWHRSMPCQQQQLSSADQQMADMYAGIGNAIRFGELP